MGSRGGKRLVVCVVGMPGSGKSVVSRVAREMGFDVVVMGDAVRDVARERGIEPSGRAMRELMQALRHEGGPAVVAKLCFPRIDRAGQLVLVDGIRSLHEVEAFRGRYGNVVLIAVHSSPRTRFKRLRARGREDDPRTWEEFRKRDEVELKVGIGSAIALADFMLVNEGTLEELEGAARELLEKLVREANGR